tara:strand:- start:589 stop:888 length:300 start_codon:yes stop_codon:yes gene_type:complete
MIKLEDLKVTDFDIIDYSLLDVDPNDNFNINVILNDQFWLQLGTDGEWSFPSSYTMSMQEGSQIAKIQDYLCEAICEDEVAKRLNLPKSIFDWYEFKIS